jgi:Protein of unknown function (DUF2949)
MAVLPSEVIEQNSQGAFQKIDWVTPTESTELEFLDYLKDELSVPADSIELAMRHCKQERGTLPMVLWRYGFVSIDQLNQIFDWMAR